ISILSLFRMKEEKMPIFVYNIDETSNKSSGRMKDISYLALFRGSGSRDDICRIIHQYTDNPKRASKIIDKHLKEWDFVVFDFIKPVDDSLAIRLGWDTPLKIDE
ncbi:337_t:CDS:2, partial [Entrophospora sp. SA101]